MSKESYKNKIDSIKTNIAKKKGEITSYNDKIKDYQAQKTQIREKYQARIKSASNSNEKANYRNWMSNDLKNVDSSIANCRDQIAKIKTQIESLKRELKQAQEAYKNAKK